MEAERKKIEKKMLLSTARLRKLSVVVLMISLILVACSTPALHSTQPTSEPVKVTSETLPSITPTTTSKGSIADDPVVRSYHTLLMLEHSADLILAVIVKIQNAEISQSDFAAISPYTNAFSVTVQTLNEVSPPAEFEDPWTQVLMAAQQYSQAYTMINRGMPISSQNLDLLKDTRKLLVIDQQMFEAYLIRNGRGSDFFVAQMESVDRHLQQLYGD